MVAKLEELPYIVYKVKCLEVLRSTHLRQANSDLEYSLLKLTPKRILNGSKCLLIFANKHPSYAWT